VEVHVRTHHHQRRLLRLPRGWLGEARDRGDDRDKAEGAYVSLAVLHEIGYVAHGHGSADRGSMPSEVEA